MRGLQLEPPVKQLKAVHDKAWKECQEAAVRIGKKNAQFWLEVGMRPGNHDKEYEDRANRAIAEIKPYTQAVDTSIRRYHKTWYRFATGLAANVADPEWHEKIVLATRVEMNEQWVELLNRMIFAYAVGIKPAGSPPGSSDLTGVVPEGSVPPGCPEGLRDAGLKLQLPKIPLPIGPELYLGIKMTCEKVAVEAAIYPWKLEGSPVEAAAGGFVQVELANKGKVSVFAGGVAKGAFGLGATLKAGVQISSNLKTGQIDAITPKASIELSGKLASDLTVSQKMYLPSLPEPSRGPDMRRAPGR
jgi:hypothetical protein